MNEHDYSPISTSGQGKYPAFVPPSTNRLAFSESRRLFTGLERFVNTGDSIEAYWALRKGWPGFWPKELVDLQGNSLAWHADCHDLFVVFREALRYVWIPLPDELKSGTLAFLFGIGGVFHALTAGQPIFPAIPLGVNEAWDKIKRNHSISSEITVHVVDPMWMAGNLVYLPSNDFQRALYQLFQESWRAKVCIKCATFFVANKPAQLYCGTACSGGAKRERTLKWWREKGAKLRVEKAKALKNQDRVKQGGRKRR